MTKILMVLALGGLGSGFIFASGVVNVTDLPALYVTLPAGAIFFGLFLISLMLEKESARFDQEHRHADSVQQNAGSTSPREHHGRLVSAKA